MEAEDTQRRGRESSLCALAGSAHGEGWPEEGVCQGSRVTSVSPGVPVSSSFIRTVGKGVSTPADAMALSGEQSQSLSPHGNFASLTLAPALSLSSYLEIHPPHPLFLWRGCWLSGTPLWKNRVPRRDHHLHQLALRLQGFGEGSEPYLPNHRQRTWEPQPSPGSEV